jgi:hypothetical protein
VREARPDPTWQPLLVGVPAGVAVAAFLAVRWPLDLVAAPALLAYLAVLSRLRRGRRPLVRLREAVPVTACVAVALLACLAGVLGELLLSPPWLPGPVLAGLAATAVACAGIAVLYPGRGSR